MKIIKVLFRKEILLACAVALCSIGTVRALEAEAYSDEKLKALIGELGNDDFTKRDTAEKELLKAGLKAQKSLEAAQESPDAQVKATVKRLLGKLRWSQVKDVDFLTLLPGDSIVYFDVTSLKTIVDKFQNTSLAKTGNSKGLEALRAKITEQLNSKPDVKDKLNLWTKRFNAQIAGGVWEANMMAMMAGQGGVKAGLVAEITDPEPSKVYSELIAEMQFDNAEAGSYEDVSYLNKAQGPAIGLAGKYLLVAANVDSLKQMIDGFKLKTGIAATPAYKKLKTALGVNPDIIATLDYETFLKTFGAMLMAQPGMEEMMSSSGIKDIKQLCWASSITGDSFEDRFVSIMAGPPKGLSAVSIAPADVTPLNIAGIVPANACGFVATYVDGSKAYPALMEYLASMKKAQPNAPDAEEKIKEFEEKYNLKVADLLGGIKGEIGMWLQMAAAPDGAPDWGVILTCASTEKAAAVSDAIVKCINAETKIEAVKDADYKNRKIHQVDPETLGANAPKQVKYQPSWTVDGNRIIFGSTSAVIQKELTAIDSKTPGLLTQPDFVKAMGSFSADERKGNVYYLDAKAVLTASATVGLPLLGAAPNVPEDVKQILAGLPAPTELFKEMGPIVGVQVVNGDEAKVIVRAPVSPAVVILVGVSVFSVMQVRAMGGGGF